MMDEEALARQKSGVGRSEFIVLIAALTSVVAISIDVMLPALSKIGEDFAITDPNDQQFTIISFVIAFGVGQIFFGPLSDRFGRRPVLLLGLAIFVISSLAAAFANSFELLIIFRAAAGIGAAAVRITTNAIVRDCYEGRSMAVIMSFVFTVFMVIPVVAPAIGQLTVSLADWHWLFVMLGAFGLLLSAWALLRMKETLPDDKRRSLQFTRVLAAFSEILSNRVALGYTIAVTLFFGALFSFVISVAQIIEVTYQKGELFFIIFAGIAGAMAIGSFSNATLVKRFGMRRISHIGVIVFVIFSLVLLIVSFSNPPLWLAMPIIAAIMLNFGLVAGNFNSIAMEPLGHMAGSASSVMGTISFTGGAILGGITGQMFDGTLTPIASAYFGYGALALVTLLVTERGQLFERAKRTPTAQ